ncbi:hypothetical protein KIPB_006326 [Kipferlia bialata]|uniref:Uncharacterized protein n=1 Tax=Kipferlia bialata TaxID=797122 RepID=A0A9K3CYN7_9EUKA|nr:hypothetical protein KIPB_006326 [Kipferlia bialata]|eukprot:g6326.t1
MVRDVISAVDDQLVQSKAHCGEMQGIERVLIDGQGMMTGQLQSHTESIANLKRMHSQTQSLIGVEEDGVSLQHRLSDKMTLMEHVLVNLRGAISHLSEDQTVGVDGKVQSLEATLALADRELARVKSQLVSLTPRVAEVGLQGMRSEMLGSTDTASLSTRRSAMRGEPTSPLTPDAQEDAKDTRDSPLDAASLNSSGPVPSRVPVPRSFTFPDTAVMSQAEVSSEAQGPLSLSAAEASPSSLLSLSAAQRSLRVVVGGQRPKF